MTTNQRSLSFAGGEYQYELVPDRTEVVACIQPTHGSNGIEIDRPFARPDTGSETHGTCAECGEGVEIDRIGPDNPSLFTFVAQPHARVRRYYLLDDVELDRLVTCMEMEYGSIR